MNITPINRLQYILDVIPNKLSTLSEAQFSHKLNPKKWSNKEILGHLIDSATNNHQRFVRAKFEETPVISYNQEKWNTYSNYAQISILLTFGQFTIATFCSFSKTAMKMIYKNFALLVPKWLSLCSFWLKNMCNTRNII